MKKILPVFFLFSVLFLNGCKKDIIPNLFVEKVYTAPGSLNVIHFTDATHGYAGGDNGLILMTTDGGTTWTPVTVGPTISARFNCISFPSHDTGWVTGMADPNVSNSHSAAYSTYNGGMTWQYRGTLPSMYLCFPEKNVGYRDEAYTDLYKTTNSGASWTHLVGAPYPGFNFSNLFFVNKDTGFVGTDYSEYFTVNGGVSWNTLHIESASQIAFAPDKLHGVAMHYSGGASLTSDGGITWTDSYIEGSDDYQLGCVCMPSSNVILTGGLSGLFVTVDGGSSWKQYYQDDGTSFPGEMRGVDFFNEYNGFAVTTEGGIYRLRRVDEPK